MALAWILHLPGITSVLVGASNTKQLQQNLRCVHASPFAEDIEEMANNACDSNNCK